MNTNELHQLWNDLHAHPEVSWKEKETTTYLMSYFSANGFEPKAFTHIPGFYVDIGGGSPVIGLRADMDALYQEVNGTWQANHSCGHDAHMTIVTGAMHRLKSEINKDEGTIRAIFQPAEEIGGGAIGVVKEGIVDDVDYLFGVHVRPENEMTFPSCAPSIAHGGCLFIEGNINGTDHHGARPHEGVNAIEVVYSLLHHIQQMHVSPMIPASVKMTNVHAGSDNLNIIPGSAQFGLDVRSQSNEVLAHIKEMIQRTCSNMENQFQVDISLDVKEEVPAALIHEEAEDNMRQAIMNCLGKVNTEDRLVTSGSDDFHYYTTLRPKIKATMLALGADVSPGLHHPEMTFQQEALENGTAILKEVCLLTLEQKKFAEGSL